MQTGSFLEILDSVDSTNNYAMAKVREGMAKHGMAFIAKEQTAGKGQRGKSWQMEAGKNITMTLVLNTGMLRAEEQFYLSMLISLGAADFLKNNVGADITIKWPNDLYWRDRKAGGILIETVMQGAAWKWAIVGIGININQTLFEKHLPNPVSLKNITGRDYDVIGLAKMLYQFVMKRVESIAAQSPGKVLEEYNRNLYKMGETVKLKKANAVFQTHIKGVSMLGQLHTVDTMERQFNFGEVEWVL
jgi:BirA family transcriptional regulator, biotin operon repressor / biotin---[acetyl-CoA-carboxylase] ligase